MALSDLLELDDKQFPYDVMELRLGEEEAFRLTQEGYDPTGFTSISGLARFWDLDEGSIRVAVHRFKIPKVKVGRATFLPIVEALRAYQPRSATQEQKNLLHRTLGSVDTTVEGQLEELRQIYDDYSEDGESAASSQLKSRTNSKLTKRTQADYLRALAAEVTTEDWRKIVRKAVDQAMDGDARSREWLANYLIGRPIQRMAAVIDDVTEKFNEDERRQALMSMLFGEEDSNGNGKKVVNGEYSVK